MESARRVSFDSTSMGRGVMSIQRTRVLGHHVIFSTLEMDALSYPPTITSYHLSRYLRGSTYGLFFFADLIFASLTSC